MPFNEREQVRIAVPSGFPLFGACQDIANSSCTLFALLQLVSVSGDHAWIAPSEPILSFNVLPDFLNQFCPFFLAATDQRGPCPGLNAAANHNYLPRSGIASAATVNTGLFEAFGLGADATAFLQATTSFFDGDPITGLWSIGGYSAGTFFWT